MLNILVKLYKEGIYKDTIYHVDNIVYDDVDNVIRIFSYGYVTTLKHPKKWHLSISYKEVVKDE